jgi:hypothetical protein
VQTDRKGFLRPIAFPFIRPDKDNFLEGTDWALIEPALNSSPEEGIPGWDHNQPLRLARQLIIDVDRLLKECQLEGAAFICTVQALTGPTTLRREIWRSDLMEAGKMDLPIQLAPTSSDLYRELSLVTSILLARPGKPRGRASPKVVGSRLWEESLKIDLSGSLGRLAMSPVKFSEWFPNISNALWELVWEPEVLDQSESNIVLYVNSERSDFLENRENPMTLNAIKTDIFFRMISAVLRDEDALMELAAYERGTVGFRINEWLSVLEKSQPREILADMARANPESLIPIIQSELLPA